MQRKTLLRKKLSKLAVDGILITDLNNIRYISGFTGTSAYILLTKKHAVFVSDFRYREQIQSEVKNYTVIIEHTERTKEIKEICKKYGIKTLGFEDHNVTYDFYNKLLKTKIRLKPLTNTVGSLRIVKSPEEISFIKESVKRAESAFRKLQPLIKAGTTEQKLAMKMEELLRAEGCKMLPFGVIVASGSMSALPHAQPTTRRLQKGDLVVIDWGAEYKGYFSDMTRTLLLKSRNISRQRELYYNVLEAQKKAVKSVRAGIKSAEIDAAARDYIDQKGYGDFFGHGTGHGVGLEVHEKPIVSWRNKETIKENMVFTVEPGIYIPGFGGVRIEDMVLAGKKEAEVLTSLPKKLKII
jgi:Xaa-Pro aminopeptidase